MAQRDYGTFRDLAGRDWRVRDDHENPGGLRVEWAEQPACEVVAFRISKDEARRLRALLGDATGEVDA